MPGLRLVVEDWNEPAHRQVARLGYRPAGAWVMGERAVGEASPDATGNGERHPTPTARLRRAPASEAEPAYLAWATSELARAGRELFPVGWAWRRLVPADLEGAARRGALWEGQAGWALAQPDRDTFRVSWVATGPDEALEMGRALVGRAIEAGVDRIEVMAPEADWLKRALRRSGMELHPMTVYAKGMGGASP